MRSKRLAFYVMMAFVLTTVCIRVNVYAAEDNVFYMSAGGRQIKVQMVDNAATRELKNMLAAGDLTINMTGNSFEQYGSLGKSLPTADTSITAQAGDVLLYNSDTLCVFYGSNSYSYTRIGKIQGLSKDELKSILSGKDLTITLSDNSFGTVPNTGVADRAALKRFMVLVGCVAVLSWWLVINKRMRGGKIAQKPEE